MKHSPNLLEVDPTVDKWKTILLSTAKYMFYMYYLLSRQVDDI